MKSDLQTTIVWQKNWNAIHEKDSTGQRRYRYIVDEGSSRSSKTISLIDCYDLYARAYHNKRMTVWRDTKTDCKKTVLNDTLKRLKTTSRYGVGQDFNKTESIFSYANGSTFEIHGTDDEETVHGLTQDVAWLNEPYKISKDTFDQIDQRTSDFIFIDWNPKKSHWIDDLKKDPRTLVIHSTFKDNPFCPEEQRRKILSYQPVKRCAIVETKLLTEQEAKVYDIADSQFNNIAMLLGLRHSPTREDEIKYNDYLVRNIPLISDKMKRELTRCRENEAKNSANDFNWSVYGLGEKAERPNRIYHWEEINIEDYLKISAARVYGVDWGTVDPWGIVECKYYDGGLYFNELNYESENEIRAKLSSTELSQINADDEGIVKWKFRKLSIPEGAEIVCDTNRPLKIAVLRRCGWIGAMPASSKAILDGIDLLNNVKCYFTSTSINLKYEQENYSRKTDSTGVVLEEPEDVDNHLLDPARYIGLRLQAKGVIKRL